MTDSKPDSISLSLPSWLDAVRPDANCLWTDETRLQFVIELSQRNVEAKTGGPFAAAVFETGTGRPIAAGVNRVEPLTCSIAHAEVMAIALAQQTLRTFDLGPASSAGHELVTSAQPCLMCLGAILWSGVTRLLFAATAQDVEAILGFDEGFVAAGWKQELQSRGVEVVGPQLRGRAPAVLEQYRAAGGTIYAGRSGGGNPGR